MNCERPWTVADLEMLATLWADQKNSTAEIGRRINRSKHSVVGKAHRQELPPRPSPIIRRPVAPVPTPRAQPLPPGARTLPPLPSEMMA